MIELRPGDPFVVHSDGTVPDMVNLFQSIWSPDHKSEYSHSGFVMSPDGETFESRKRIGRYHLKDFEGCPIFIVRHALMTPERFQQGWDYVKKHEGAIYPVMRLALHAVGLASYVHWKHPVCSELECKFEVGAYLRREWWGKTPDNLADQWVSDKNYLTLLRSKSFDYALIAH